MTLIVTDSSGRKYKPTGQFREPKVGDYYWSTSYQEVWQRGTEDWLSHSTKAHPFGTMCIILEPVPVEYEVTVRLTEDLYTYSKDPSFNSAMRNFEVRNEVSAAIRMGNYHEVQL